MNIYIYKKDVAENGWHQKQFGRQPGPKTADLIIDGNKLLSLDVG